MNLLLLSFYYPPDLSAGSFRAVALVKALETVHENVHITVFTTQPNRYRDLSDKVSQLEQAGKITIIREDLPSHNSGVLSQAIAFGKYAYRTRSFSKKQDWDVVVATSSRLMTAFLGASISRRANIPLYLDIRDLFVDTIKEVFNRYLLWIILPIAKIIEKYTFRSASKINVVSKGFVPYIEKVVPNTDLSVLTNGVDKEFLNNISTNEPNSPVDDRPLVILYAGNVGEGQGLHSVLPDAAKLLGSKVKFRVVGSGGRISQLVDAAALSNDSGDASEIEVLPPVPRDQLIAEYQNADILFVHLNNYTAFEKVLPSKLFEYGATGKPIIAGVGGYAAQFVSAELEGAVVFKPGDSEGLANAVEDILQNLNTIDRSEFCEKYSRAKIMGTMASDIVRMSETYSNSPV